MESDGLEVVQIFLHPTSEGDKVTSMNRCNNRTTNEIEWPESGTGPMVVK